MDRKMMVLVCCGLFFLCGLALGQVKEGGNNGARWKTLSEFERTVYVFGFSRGYEQGFEEAGGVCIANTLSKKSLPVLTPERKQQVLKLAAQARDHSYLGGKTTVSAVLSTVDTFYGDYRNAAVCWNDAVLFASVSLEGRTPTEESLEAARKNGATTGCN